MKIGSKFILIGILSLLVGSAFASPLLISELEIMPSPRLPEGPKAEFSVNVVYANFSVQDNANITAPDWYPESETGNLSAVSYFVVLNITNHSDEVAVIMDSILTVAEDVSKGVYNGTFGGGCWVEGVWLDGEWVNVTRFPSRQLDNGTWIDAYLQEGVYVRYGYSNGELTSNSMYIDGSWVDVTGRINVTLNEDAKIMVLTSGNLVSQFYLFQSRGEYNAPDDNSDSFFPTIIWSGPEDFNNTWAPHQSRLIALTGTEIFCMPDGIEALKIGTMFIRAEVSNHLTNPFYNGTRVDTWSTAEEIKQIQLELTDDGYIYNTILSDDQMFVMDSFGVEVFIQPRN
jgi:hypothetical protein